MNKIRDELNRWLVPAFGEKLYLDFDYSNISELQEEMDKVVDQMSKSWWLTPNEKRQAMSYGVDSDNEALNNFYVPVNLVALEDDVIEDEVKSLDLDYNNLYRKEEIREDVFDNPAEAMNRAKEIGCNEIHSHEENGRTIFMPCKTHSEYEEAINEDKNYHHEDQKDLEIKPVKPGSAVERGLKNKVKDHNDKYGDNPSKRVTYRMLQAVFNRGIGAYRTNPQSVRPSVRSEDQWAYARVNSFLYAVRNGRHRGGKHDGDLFPSGHPLRSKKKYLKKQMYDDYPQGATNNAKRMLEWREKYGRDVVKGGTQVGWTRANQLAKREALSLDTVKRIHSFLSRHKDNAQINPKFKNEPWKDNGYVAYNLWGGANMVSYAKRIAGSDE